MKKIAGLLLFCLLTLAPRAEDASAWLTDFSMAKKTAKTEDKKILALFTGSDWCPMCMLLAKKTFSQPAFQAYAAENLVLLELDFPQYKPQSEALKKQNAKLAFKYDHDQFFPTLILLDSKGEEITRISGRVPGGPAGFIKWVEDAKKADVRPSPAGQG